MPSDINVLDTSQPTFFPRSYCRKDSLIDTLLKGGTDSIDQEPLIEEAAELKALARHGLRFQHETHGNRNAVERVFREVKHRTLQFSNCFSHADADTIENWLKAFAFAWNQLI